MTRAKEFKAIKVSIKDTTDKCDLCAGSKCCQYITQSIDTPRSMDDFDHLLWQLAHGNIQAYKDEDGWFLLVLNQCGFLQHDGR